jgi:hypothetical protein
LATPEKNRFPKPATIPDQNFRADKGFVMGDTQRYDSSWKVAVRKIMLARVSQSVLFCQFTVNRTKSQDVSTPFSR